MVYNARRIPNLCYIGSLGNMKGGKGSGRPGRKNYEVGRRRDVRSFRDLASVQKENEDSLSKFKEELQMERAIIPHHWYGYHSHDADKIYQQQCYRSLWHLKIIQPSISM